MLCVLAFLLALPASASAHSLVRPGGPVVSYLSQDATSLNELIVRPDGNRIEFLDRAVDGGIDPGPCAPGELDASGLPVQVFCPAGPVERVRIDLGDREDTATVSVPVNATILAGTGADRVTSGPGGDELDGGTGNDVLAGGAGNDVIVGAAGADELSGGDGDDRIGASDGEADTVACGAGADTVEADALDSVDASCEAVTRTGVPPVTGGGDVPGPPVLAVGAPVLQSAKAIRVYATAGEPATLSASGFLGAAGLQLPIARLAAREVTVGGGGVVLEYRLQGRLKRVAARAMRRGKKVRVGLSVVATDPGGASSRKAAPTIRLQRPAATRAFRGVRHPEPGDEDGDEVTNTLTPQEGGDNCPTVKNGSQTNTDREFSGGDIDGDACDADDDADGVADVDDRCRTIPGTDCVLPDADSDGVPDEDDNCDTVANPGQADLDGDDKGDDCDPDDDGDDFFDEYDNCPTVYNPELTDRDGDGNVDDQTDADGDGEGTACDPDESTVTPPPAATPTPTPAPLAVTVATAASQRLKVIGAGPIVTVNCSAACAVASRLTTTSGRRLATGAARLAGPGTTFVFLRLRGSARKPTAATLTTTVTDADGAATTLSAPVRLKR